MSRVRVFLCGALGAAVVAGAVVVAPPAAEVATAADATAPATRPATRPAPRNPARAARQAARAAEAAAAATRPGGTGLAEQPATRGSLPPPTLADVAYGKHPKQVLHFWKAKPAAAGNPSDPAKPTPVLVFIHGGGWVNGNRYARLEMVLPQMLANGVSVASVEYRFIAEATADGVVPPVKGPLTDAARAVQFVRSKAAEWNLDKTKLACSGTSAGACTSLWLAFHDDLADPKSSDPVARESTRPLTVAVGVPQTSLDPKQMREWIPNSRYGPHAFGVKPEAGSGQTAFDAFLAGREKLLPLIGEYSPYALVTPDDAPVYMTYPTKPNMGQEEKDPTHSANFGVKLQEHMKAVGVKCELMYPDAPGNPHPSMADYLLAILTK